MTDTERVRRDGMRWRLIDAMNKNRPYTSGEEFLRDLMQAIYPDATALEVRRELDYLADRGLVLLDKRPSGQWFGELTRHGVDIAEYTIACDPGIARPEKYWSD